MVFLGWKWDLKGYNISNEYIILVEAEPLILRCWNYYSKRSTKKHYYHKRTKKKKKKAPIPTIIEEIMFFFTNPVKIA